MGKQFGIVGSNVLKILREKGEIKDVLLMMELEFSPETWRHWKAKLIELFQIMIYKKEGKDGKIIKEQIVYDKKQKLWFVQEK